MPDDFDAAAGLIEACVKGEDALQGWVLWPFGEYVARRGPRLQTLVQDPAPTLPLLAALQDDPSDYVRRSVANHLNDIAKDHPELVAQWPETHLPEAPAERRALLRHASRSLIKQGHRRVLSAWGLGQPFRGSAALGIHPPRVLLGDGITLELTLASSARQSQALVVDYAVHHVKADGSLSPKVLKGWKLELPARGNVALKKRHALRPIKTRRYYSGRHVVEVQINGVAVAQGDFTLDLP